MYVVFTYIIIHSVKRIIVKIHKRLGREKFCKNNSYIKEKFIHICFFLFLQRKIKENKNIFNASLCVLLNLKIVWL